MNIYEQIDFNKRATALLIFSFISFFLFIGFGFDYYMGLGLVNPVFTIGALLFSVISSILGWRYGDRLVLASVRARELDLNDPAEKQWQNVIEEMKIASGIPLPKAYIINDADPNAFATGSNPDTASIAVTKGLLNTLSRDELQAVAAHEMSHIKNFDTRLMLIVSILLGSVALLSDWALRGIRYGYSGQRQKKQGRLDSPVFFIWLITVLLAPLISQMMAMFVSRNREYLADASAAELTRNPLALASALEKIDKKTGPTYSINQGTAHLCICDPKGRALNNKDGWFADLFSTHPPIDKRISALKQMGYLK